MESFIRSKYESKRWAREGPLPLDPSVLENGVPNASAAPAVSQQQSPPSQSSTTRPPAATAVSARAAVTRQPQTHQLLSSNFNNSTQSPTTRAPAASQQVAATPPPAQQPAAPANDLFSLDFHAPPPSNPGTPDLQAAPKKDVKQDILSLFSSPPQQVQPAGGHFGQFSGAAPMAANNVWGAPAPTQQVPTSMVGNNGVGAWGVSSGWNAPATTTPQSNLWGGAAAQPAAPATNSLFNTSDVWGSSSANQQPQDPFGAFGSAPTTTTQKKDDAFGDLWGGFK